MRRKQGRPGILLLSPKVPATGRHLAEVMADLKDANLRLAKIEQQKVVGDDQLRRIEIRAPVAGRVQQLAVHTQGGVIGPGETLMLIVPQDDSLVVEARVDPQHVDQVKAGNRGHTPILFAKHRPEEA